MVFVKSILNALVSAALVSAHFTLDYPTSRGFSDDDEPTAPCGGFNDVTTNRSSFPLSGGRYQIDSHHAQATVQLIFSTDGTTFSQSPVETYTITGLGTLCGILPASVLSSYTAGSNVTMQIVYKASTETTPLYQCADLTLVSSAETAGTCTNSTGVSVTQLRLLGGSALQASGSAVASGSAAATRASVIASAVNTASAATTSAASKTATNAASQMSSWKGAEIIAAFCVVLSVGVFAI